MTMLAAAGAAARPPAAAATPAFRATCPAEEGQEFMAMPAAVTPVEMTSATAAAAFEAMMAEAAQTAAAEATAPAQLCPWARTVAAAAGGDWIGAVQRPLQRQADLEAAPVQMWSTTASSSSSSIASQKAGMVTVTVAAAQDSRAPGGRQRRGASQGCQRGLSISGRGLPVLLLHHLTMAMREGETHTGEDNKLNQGEGLQLHPGHR